MCVIITRVTGGNVRGIHVCHMRRRIHVCHNNTCHRRQCSWHTCVSYEEEDTCVSY